MRKLRTNSTPRVEHDRRGFTLIELLVVVLIIGILAAIAIPQYFKVVERARVAEALSCIDAIQGSQERYYLKYGTYNGNGGQNSATGLDMSCPTMKAFLTPYIYGDTCGNWIYMYRSQSVAVYGQYYILSVVDPTGCWGWPSPTVTCSQWTPTPSQTGCQADLIPQQ